jgi:hypothetical protein
MIGGLREQVMSPIRHPSCDFNDKFRMGENWVGTGLEVDTGLS